jgi:hypothetical protein
MKATQARLDKEIDGHTTVLKEATIKRQIPEPTEMEFFLL